MIFFEQVCILSIQLINNGLIKKETNLITLAEIKNAVIAIITQRVILLMFLCACVDEQQTV